MNYVEQNNAYVKKNYIKSKLNVALSNLLIF